MTTIRHHALFSRKALLLFLLCFPTLSLAPTATTGKQPQSSSSPSRTASMRSSRTNSGLSGSTAVSGKSGKTKELYDKLEQISESIYAIGMQKKSPNPILEAKRMESVRQKYEELLETIKELIELKTQHGHTIEVTIFLRGKQLIIHSNNSIF